jgi:hypothetical protein
MMFLGGVPGSRDADHPATGASIDATQTLWQKKSKNMLVRVSVSSAKTGPWESTDAVGKHVCRWRRFNLCAVRHPGRSALCDRRRTTASSNTFPAPFGGPGYGASGLAARHSRINRQGA